jgi:hypothetical protein
VPYSKTDHLRDKLDVDLRIRPANDNELSTNRKERNYRPATDYIITTGVGARAKSYRFNHVYNEHALTKHVQQRVKDKFIREFRYLFMCYGQTGAGKTHTMSGGAWKDHGLIQDFFIHTVNEDKKWKFPIHVTMNQLHQSEIKDLFREGFEAPPQLKIHRGNKDGDPLVSIENTTELRVDWSKPTDDLIDAINRGINNRKTRDNIDNETSSRSHVIFSIYLNTRTMYKYTFIDLAGAERVAKIEISPKLYLEAIFINESLEELQRVIRDLTSGVLY